MPVVERNITYFFPTSKASRLEAIETNRKAGRTWVSTSIQQGGHQRMKFCTLSHKPSKPTAKQGYAGKDRNGRKEWDS
jgi:hypothetical protein